jgi:hypothetical protein
MLGGCSGNDYYHRAPFPNGGRIDQSFADAARDFADLLSGAQSGVILLLATAPFAIKRMRHFVNGYGGHVVTVSHLAAADDNVADETLVVSCRPGVRQRLSISWGWFNGAWRAWPHYQFTATGEATEYPGC